MPNPRVLHSELSSTHVPVLELWITMKLSGRFASDYRSQVTMVEITRAWTSQISNGCYFINCVNSPANEDHKALLRKVHKIINWNVIASHTNIGSGKTTQLAKIRMKPLQMIIGHGENKLEPSRNSSYKWTAYLSELRVSNVKHLRPTFRSNMQELLITSSPHFHWISDAVISWVIQTQVIKPQICSPWSDIQLIQFWQIPDPPL